MKNKIILLLAVLLSLQGIVFAASTWITQSPTKEIIYSGAAINNTTALAGGLKNYIVKTTNGGTSWTEVTIADTNLTWRGMGFVPSSTTGYVVGQSASGACGIVYKTTDGGSTWASSSTGISAANASILYDVSAPSTNVVYAAGHHASVSGVLKSTDGGSTWSLMNGPLGNKRYYGIFALTNNLVWTVGEAGKIYKSTDGGTSGAEQASGVLTTLNDVFFVDANNGWIGGDSGVILHTVNGGTNWTSQTPIGFTANLRSIYFVNSLVGWAAGDATLLKTIDGGANWTSDLSTSNRLYALSFTDQYCGWAFGYNGNVSGVVNYLRTDPTVSSISPSSAVRGSTTATDFTITGDQFKSGLTAAFSNPGITVNSVTYNSATAATANLTIPASAATGVGTFTITNVDGAASNTGLLTVNASSGTAPVVTAVSPSSGTQGTTVTATITGTDLPTSNGTITFGNSGVTGAIATYSSSTSLQVSVNVGAAAATGWTSITVTDNTTGLSSAAKENAFNVASATDTTTPTITSLRPGDFAVPTTSGVETIRVNGTNFGSAPIVMFNPTLVATISATSNTQVVLSVTIPSSAVAGNYSVTVTRNESGRTSTPSTLVLRAQSADAGIINDAESPIFGPNPWYPNINPTTTLYFKASKDISSLDVYLFGINGDMIYKTTVTGIKAGRNKLVYDGSTFSSHKVSSGMFLVMFVADRITSSYKAKCMVVR